MQNCKKLIEVAMPIKEISAESVRDKSIRHGHISTLHLWWARRPLSVCRAVVFASLVPDPLDKNCPQAFRDAVKILLGKSNNISDSYKPYDDIPYTAAIDKMEDNLRNRLLMFIGKFSERYILNEKQGRKTDSKDALSDSSLIKWDNRNNEEVLNKARKLIWVAHNSANGVDANKMLAEFEEYFKAIKDAENSLYNLENRHIKSESIKFKEKKLQDAINSFLDKMPKVFDPFAGGGAIPLESSRLGCRSFGNDLNPVAHIVQKGSVEFPQKFGKPITYSKSEFINLYGESEFRNVLPENKILNNGEVVAVRINNRLSFDIGILSNILILKAKQLFSYLYPDGERNESLVANIWARVAKCKNPSCKAEVPLLRQFYLVNKDNNSIFLQPQIKGNKIEFEIKNGLCHENPWVNRGNLTCPCCKNVTDVNVIKSQFVAGQTKERLLAVIYENKEGKIYRLPSKVDFDAFNLTPDPYEIPFEKMQRNSAGGDTFTWGIDTWSSLLSKRQLYSILELIKLINDDSLFEQYKRDIEYKKALKTYLAILIDRFADYNTRHCVWISNMELIAHLFGRQAIPMNLDYAESNPLGNSTGSLLSQLNWIQRYIESESINPFSSICVNTASGNLAQFPLKSLDAVITDPPYFDAIAYADISDYFYVWLKRSLKSEYPYNFSTPQTPKSEECTALKHHHNDDPEKAKMHFENLLKSIFTVIEKQTDGIVSIMFAHQSTEAWSTLCNSILGASLSITGSWTLDSERPIGLKSNKSFLASSVTVSCKPSKKTGVGNYKDVKSKIEQTVYQEVGLLYGLGFRGADLLTACFGQAVNVFGQYEKVEKADGNEVTVPELLEMVKESAFNALLKGFDGDDFTKFYIGWLQLYGFAESDFDDAAKFSRVGLSINVSDLFTHNIFIKRGNKQELAGYKDRLTANRKIGDTSQSFIIDNVHKSMALYEGTNRNALLEYIAKIGASPENSFWRVITSLCEVLPQGSDDYKQATGLLLNKDSLIRESKNIQQSTGEQGQLF